MSFVLKKLQGYDYQVFSYLHLTIKRRLNGVNLKTMDSKSLEVVTIVF